MIKIPGTRMAFRTLDEWRELHYSRLVHARVSRQEYERQDRIFKALTPQIILGSHDLSGLRRLQEYLRGGRGIGFVRFDAGRTWRGHHTALLVAVHNRVHQLETGSAYRNRVRHGPADPAQMPDDALDRVIQGCRDMDLVDRCRVEKAKRMREAA